MRLRIGNMNFSIRLNSNWDRYISMFTLFGIQFDSSFTSSEFKYFHTELFLLNFVLHLSVSYNTVKEKDIISGIRKQLKKE